MPVSTELSTIVEGMTICDANGKHIGTIDTFYLGKGILGDNGSDQDTVEKAIKDIIGESNLLESLIPKIYETGFFYIECGFLKDNVLILPHQIDAIEGEEVCLNIAEDELLSF